MKLVCSILLLVVLSALLAVASSQCNHLTAIDCSSRDFAFARCSIPGAGEITSLSVTRKYSRSSCTYDWSYGHQGGQVWVNQGCRAQFAVCYNTGNPDACRFIDCSSRNYRYELCTVPGATTVTAVTLSNKYSRSSCSLGSSYGSGGNKVWVNHGCRGQFWVCYR